MRFSFELKFTLQGYLYMKYNFISTRQYCLMQKKLVKLAQNETSELKRRGVKWIIILISKMKMNLDMQEGNKSTENSFMLHSLLM